MNVLRTLYDCPDEWYQDTYVCLECETEFMTDQKDHPRFCPQCGVKFDVLRIVTSNYKKNQENIETIFLNNETEETT